MRVSSKRIMCLAAAFLVLFLMSGAVFAGHGEKVEKKTGILLVAFGTSIPEARVSFDNLEAKTKAAYPDIPIRWAYTSHIIRKILAKRGQMVDSPEVALAKMMDEGFTHVAVQSLHTIAGAEFHDLLQTAHAFKAMGGDMKRVLVGYPLLATDKDVERVADALLKIIPKERKKGEAVVFMGHGTHHPANAFYAALAYRVQLKDPNVFVGGVEGFPDIDLIKDQLAQKKLTKAYLLPFMSVAGDHAQNDLAGDEEDSWKSILTKSGVSCVPVLKGTAEYDEFAAIWVEHLGIALKHFE